MLYYIKFRRDTVTQEITVEPPKMCPVGTAEYIRRIRHKKRVEAVRIYRTRQEAERVFYAETIAADFSRLDDRTLSETFRRDLDRVANSGWTVTDLCRQGHLYYATIILYSEGKLTPNPRTAAKVHLIADALENVANFARVCLSPESCVGNAKMNRGGRKDIFKSAPTYHT